MESNFTILYLIHYFEQINAALTILFSKTLKSYQPQTFEQ